MSILIWGSESKARIINQYLVESYGKGASYFFDRKSKKLSFKNDGKLLNNEIDLLNEIKFINEFIVCVGNYSGYERFHISFFLEKYFHWKPLNIYSENSYIDSTSQLGKGCQVMPGSVIHKFVEIGDYSIVNCNSSVDHECRIGNGTHIMGSAAIAGKVIIEDYVSVGTNATILPNLRIGEGAIIGAGSVITKNVEPYSVLVGVPGKKFKSVEENKKISDVSFLTDLLDKI